MENPTDFQFLHPKVVAGKLYLKQEPTEKLVLPEWGKASPYYQWANNFIWRNHWRVEHVLGGDKEDLLAECALMWVQCTKFYEKTVHTPQHMMYMYKLWVTGQFADYATKDTKIREVCQLLAYRDVRIKSEGELAVKLKEASSDLKQVMDIFLNAPQEIIEIIKGDMKTCTSKQLFKRVVDYLKIDTTKTKSLINELEDLLS